MKKTISIFIYVAIILNSYCLTIVNAQTIPPNISGINVDALSDQQITKIAEEGRSRGLNDNQIVQNAQSSGMSGLQAEKLRSRLAIVSRNSRSSNIGDTVSRGQRSLNYLPDTIINKKANLPGQLPVFGANLFRSNNNTFEPNLNLATPVNYILGPNDQVNVSIYGQSEVNWSRVVSPDGTINLPSAGVISVSGKSIEQVTSIIKSKLIEKNYAIGKGTNVKVTLGNIRSIKVLLIGEVVRPGTFTLPSLATAFNALYSAGGPNDNGSYRVIEILRNNKVIRHLDIYDFLLKGEQKDNISLQDQDIIRVPTYRTRVEVYGEVKNPAIFEVLPSETLQEVINFAGGFTSQAYRANISVSQIKDQQRNISDVTEANFKNYIPLPGDRYKVERILDRYENRVSISGAVFRPGAYQLQPDMTLSNLISKASGLREDSFGKGTIYRLNPDYTIALLSFDLKDILSKKASIVLLREDSVVIKSIFELRDPYTVQITGEIRNPGKYHYADSMKVANLILLAGGFSEGASAMRVEVARRIYDSDPNSKTGVTAKVFSVNIDSQFKTGTDDLTLKPYDLVSVYRLPGFEKQGVVTLQGEVLYPGVYTIANKSERISDLIKRAGGLISSADAEGSTLKRTAISQLSNKSTADSISSAQERMQRSNQFRQRLNDTSGRQGEIDFRNDFVGLKMAEILKQPGSATDLFLKNGDIIRIPQQQQLVQVTGEVNVPGSVIYERNKGFKQYILNAGGYSDNALKRGAYIIYQNGTVEGTHKFLFFRSYPRIKPGSEVFVPKKSIRRGLGITEVIGLITALGTTAILAIISLKK